MRFSRMCAVRRPMAGVRAIRGKNGKRRLGSNVAALAALALAGCATPSAVATPEARQPGPTQACPDPEFRQLDFWVGAWDVRWDATPNQAAGSGTNTITREYGDCVIQEHFLGGPSTDNLIGHSASTYHRQIGHWRQTWVDNKGGYFALVGGPQGDTFVLESTRLSEAMPQVRMVYADITPESLTWRWQRSSDGGATWNDLWVIYYTRHRAGAG